MRCRVSVLALATLVALSGCGPKIGETVQIQKLSRIWYRENYLNEYNNLSYDQLKNYHEDVESGRKSGLLSDGCLVRIISFSKGCVKVVVKEDVSESKIVADETGKVGFISTKGESPF